MPVLGIVCVTFAFIALAIGHKALSGWRKSPFLLCCLPNNPGYRIMEYVNWLIRHLLNRNRQKIYKLLTTRSKSGCFDWMLTLSRPQNSMKHGRSISKAILKLRNIAIWHICATFDQFHLLRLNLTCDWHQIVTPGWYRKSLTSKPKYHFAWLGNWTQQFISSI